MLYSDYFYVTDTDRFGNIRQATVYYKDTFEIDEAEGGLHDHEINVTSVIYKGREIWNLLTQETKDSIFYEIEKRIAGY